MKSWIATLCLAMASALAGTAVNAATFTVPGTNVSFNAPSGFTPLTADEISQKYPSNRAPSFVVGNARRTTTIAADLKPNELPKDKLPQVQASFESVFERVVPGIDWKEKKLIDMKGQQWIFFEMTSRAVDSDIYNIMLITPHQGKMLVFNFNSTKSEFPAVEKELRKSLQSIALGSE
ncbi:hypothetical protein [Ottowia thiooxydans]|uniref:hypothetical protein n=1 Tax=Ottowia thiooxydans TaxID=219182 RepID=UPI0004063657|nr:hypothetical protein [Ottowia thiooxydans]